MDSNKYELEFMILKMWYWDWDEEVSISKYILLNVNDKLDECVREVVTNFALIMNKTRPKDKLINKDKLTDIMQEEIANLKLSEQPPCQYTNSTLMNVLSYTNTKGDGHIEVMGMYTNIYELLG